jgi:hypothetical protein
MAETSVTLALQQLTLISAQDTTGACMKAWVKNTVIAVIGGIAILALTVGSILYWLLAPQKGDTKFIGKFKLEYSTTTFMGHRATSAALYHRERILDRKVADIVIDVQLDPHDDERAVFDTCYVNKRVSDCGVYYYDGHKGVLHKLANVRGYSFIQVDSYWSPNGKYIALPEQASLWVADLESGKSEDIGAKLRLSVPGPQMQYIGWSPDGNALAFAVKTYTDQEPPYRNTENDLIELDPKSMSMRYVGSFRNNIRHEWRVQGSDLHLWMDENEPTFFRKASNY